MLPRGEGALPIQPRTAAATEIILQNDSLPTAASGTLLNNFLAGEKAAAWFTAPRAGTLVGVQFFWDSLFGRNPGLRRGRSG